MHAAIRTDARSGSLDGGGHAGWTGNRGGVVRRPRAAADGPGPRRNSEVRVDHCLEGAQTMKAAVIREFGTPEAFRYEVVAQPPPSPNGWLLRVNGLTPLALCDSQWATLNA